MTPLFRCLLPAAALFCATGCFSVFSPASGSIPVYGLTPPAAAPAASQRCDAVLKVLPFAAANPGGRSMVQVDGTGRISPLTSPGQWKDAPERMLTEAVYLGLARSGPFRAVVLETAPVRADLTLSGEVREFGVRVKEGHGEAVLEIGITVTDADRKLVRNTTLRVSRPLANLKKGEVPAEAVVEAMNKNLEQVTRALAASLAAAPEGAGSQP